jgi:serine/threonine protein kinase
LWKQQQEQQLQWHRHQQLPALVLEHAGPNSQWLCHNAPQQEHPTYLTEHEIKYYLCHLLVALDGLYAAGIMHRDVKPRNMLINRCSPPTRQHDIHDNSSDDGCVPNEGADDSSNYDDADDCFTTRHPSRLSTHPVPPPLMLVDLGLADFYHPGKSYNVRVASRHFKSPELLIGYDTYDYSVDLWAVGCILAGLLFRKEPFFRGKDNDDQLGRIVSVLGVQDFLRYRRKCGVRLSAGARAAIGKYCWKATSSVISPSMAFSSPSSPSSSSSSSSEDEDMQSILNSDMRHRKPWSIFLAPNCPIPSTAGMDLLDKLLVYDHEERWTAREALNHEFFDDVREKVFQEARVGMEWERSRRKSSRH